MPLPTAGSVRRPPRSHRAPGSALRTPTGLCHLNPTHRSRPRQSWKLVSDAAAQGTQHTRGGSSSHAGRRGGTSLSSDLSPEHPLAPARSRHRSATGSGRKARLLVPSSSRAALHWVIPGSAARAFNVGEQNAPRLNRFSRFPRNGDRTISSTALPSSPRINWV